MEDPSGSAPAERSGAAASNAEPPTFWSPWATVGWGVLISAVFVLVQAAVVMLWSATRPAPGTAAADGDLVAAGTLSSSVICGLLVLAVSAMRRGARPRTSLALVPPPGRSLAMWLALTLGLIVAIDLLTVLLGRPIVPEFMSEVVRTSSAELLLVAAIIVAAPLFEELFVRGFLLEGLRSGALGNAGAIAATSLFWASIHVQYGPWEIATIFVFGLVLGVARIRSGSLWVPVSMHVLANAVATAEAVIAAWGSR